MEASGTVSVANRLLLSLSSRRCHVWRPTDDETRAQACGRWVREGRGVSASVASMWHSRVFKEIRQRMRVLQEEFEEISCLKRATDELRSLRKRIVTEKND